MALVDWILDAIKSNWGAYTHAYGESYGSGSLPETLKRVNRDESEIMEGSIRKRRGDLKKNNFVGVTRNSSPTTPLGSGGDNILEPTLRVRLEGLHSDEFGHIDSNAAFESLVWKVKDAIQFEGFSPSVGDAHPGTFVRLYIENEDQQSHFFKDYFIAEFDVRLVGHREP